FQSLIGAGGGMAATFFHLGSATLMAATMYASTPCGIALLWPCSHRARKENGQSEYLYRQTPSETASDGI
ncbi:hypothetical protein CWI61_06425, partial [Neisseria meningitidis]